MTRREELERRIKSLSNSRPAWIALMLQVAALVIPFLGIVAIILILTWLAMAGLARWATREQLASLSRKEQQAEADARDFINDRAESITLRMQAKLEESARKARSEYLRNKMKLTLDMEADRRRQANRDAIMNGRKRERFMGKAIDVTPDKP